MAPKFLALFLSRGGVYVPSWWRAGCWPIEYSGKVRKSHVASTLMMLAFQRHPATPCETAFHHVVRSPSYMERPYVGAPACPTAIPAQVSDMCLQMLTRKPQASWRAAPIVPEFLTHRICENKKAVASCHVVLGVDYKTKITRTARVSWYQL